MLYSILTSSSLEIHCPLTYEVRVASARADSTLSSARSSSTSISMEKSKHQLGLNWKSALFLYANFFFSSVIFVVILVIVKNGLKGLACKILFWKLKLPGEMLLWNNKNKITFIIFSKIKAKIKAKIVSVKRPL